MFLKMSLKSVVYKNILYFLFKYNKNTNEERKCIWNFLKMISRMRPTIISSSRLKTQTVEFRLFMVGLYRAAKYPRTVCNY